MDSELLSEGIGDHWYGVIDAVEWFKGFIGASCVKTRRIQLNLRLTTRFVIRQFIAISLMISLLWGSVYAQSSVAAIPGSFKDFNGLITGHHSADGADVEGRLAVFGDSDTTLLRYGNTSNFSYAAAFSGASNIIGHTLTDGTLPSVVVAGKLVYPSRPVIEGGNLIVTAEGDTKNTVEFKAGKKTDL